MNLQNSEAPLQILWGDPIHYREVWSHIFFPKMTSCQILVTETNLQVDLSAKALENIPKSFKPQLPSCLICKADSFPPEDTCQTLYMGTNTSYISQIQRKWIHTIIILKIPSNHMFMCFVNILSLRMIAMRRQETMSLLLVSVQRSRTVNSKCQKQ